jgi:hypothetical protein
VDYSYESRKILSDLSGGGKIATAALSSIQIREEAGPLIPDLNGPERFWSEIPHLKAIDNAVLH